MNKPVYPEENLPPNPQPGIQQYAENSVLAGGMQAAMGDDNIQIQGDGNTITQTKILQISVDEIKTRQFIQTSPYKGLKKFELEDKDLFFGRDQFITQLIKKLEHRNLILLLGASGSGKSSVVRAGLIPWLSRKWGSHFVHLTFTPDQDPFESLYASLLSKFPQKEAQIAREAKADTVTQVVTKLKQSESFWFIFIDQFEELFTTTVPQKRDQFINGLVKLSQTKNNSVKIMGTMRADFLDKLSPYPQLIKTTDDSRPLIAEMQPDELRLAIEQPAAHHGVVFETGLVEEIIKNVQGQAGYLPLLQYTLNLFWETEVQTGSIHDRTLNISTYRELGGVRGALQQHTDSIYDKLPETEKLAAKRIFLKLVGITGNSESDTEWKPVLKRALRSEFSDKLEQSLLVKLIDENLLVSDRQPQSQESTVEVAHEMLLTAWTALNDWIKENHQAIALRNRLYDDVARWQSKKAEDELWAGSKLEKVVELRNDVTFNRVLGGFNETASQFIDASVGLRDRQRRRAITGLASFSTVTLLVAGFAVLQWQSSERGRIEQTALTAKGLLSVNPVTSLVTAISLVGQSRSPLFSFPNQSLPPSVQDSLLSAVQNSKEKNVFKGHQSSVIKVAISTDGRIIISGSNDNTVRLWNTQGKLLSEFRVPKEVSINSVAISTDRRTIVSGSPNGTVRLWNTQGKLLAELKGHQATVESVAISTDGRTIVSGSNDGTVRLWDTQGKLLAELRGHQATVLVAISTDGRTIVSGSGDGTVRLWNTQGKLLAELRGHRSFVTSVAISTDGRTIVSGSGDGTVRLWNTQGKLLAELRGHQRSVTSVAISTNSREIVSGSSDGTMRLWDTQGKLLAELRGHQGFVKSVAISTDGRTIVSGGDDGTVRLWDTHSKLLAELRGHRGFVKSVAISTDKRTIVSGGDDGTVRLWNTQGKLLTELTGHQRSVRSVAISAERGTIVSGSDDGTMRLWDTQGKLLAELAELRDHYIGVYSIAISTDGRTIASGCTDNTVRLWDTQGKLLAKLTGHQVYVNSVAISTDGQTIVSGSGDGTVRLWDTQGKLLAKLTGHQGYVRSIAISTDGQTIVSGGDDGTVRLWDTQGKLLAELTGHQGTVESVAISTDGQTIVSGGDDGIVRLWDTQGKLLAELTGHQGTVESVAISTDEQTIVSGGDDGTVRLWDIRFESWLKAACERLQDHPVFKEPKIFDEREAKATCEPYLKGL
jgi:WD40 repeat protein